MSITWVIVIVLASNAITAFVASVIGRGIGHTEGRREGIAEAKLWRQPR